MPEKRAAIILKVAQAIGTQLDMPELLAALSQYAWPGNIRELQNVIERCVILAAGEVLRVDPTMLAYEAPPAHMPPVVAEGASIAKPKSKPCCGRRVARSTDHGGPPWCPGNNAGFADSISRNQKVLVQVIPCPSSEQFRQSKGSEQPPQRGRQGCRSCRSDSPLEVGQNWNPRHNHRETYEGKNER